MTETIDVKFSAASFGLQVVWSEMGAKCILDAIGDFEETVLSRAEFADRPDVGGATIFRYLYNRTLDGAGTTNGSGVVFLLNSYELEKAQAS